MGPAIRLDLFVSLAILKSAKPCAKQTVMVQRIIRINAARFGIHPSMTSMNRVQCLSVTLFQVSGYYLSSQRSGTP